MATNGRQPRDTRRSKARTRTVLLAFLIGACTDQPSPFAHLAEKLSLLHRIDAAFDRALDAEKSAVLAITDETAEAFAAESKQAAAEVTQNLDELGKLISNTGRSEEKKDFAAVDGSWQNLEAIDARLLALAVANTNLKAMRLSGEDGLVALDRMLGSLAQIASRTTDPDHTTALWSASVAALRCQLLMPTHIAAAEDVQRNDLERQMHRSRALVDMLLANIAAWAGTSNRQAVEDAQVAWSDYQRITTEAIRLSRENTDIRSLAMSTTEKRHAAATFRTAVAALVTEIESTLRGTR